MVKSFSSYSCNLNGKKSQKQMALQIAKKLNQKKKPVQNFELNKEKIQQAKKQFQLRKKQKQQQLERIKNISNQKIIQSLEMAKEQNKRLNGKLSTQSSVDELLDTIFDDLQKNQ